MVTTSILSVDLQNDFFDVRKEGVGRLRKALCIPGSRRLIQYARENKHPVVHVVTGHKDLDSLPFHLAKGGQQPYCLEGTEGAQLVDGLFADGDLTIQKKQFSGFFDTRLADHLIDCHSLIVCGIATDCCVLTTAFDAANHRKHVYVPYQAVSAATLDAYIFGLQTIAKSAGAVIDLEILLRDPDRAWETRLGASQIQELAGAWYSSQADLLADFNRRRPELSAPPEATPQTIVASLEAFLSAETPT